MQIQSRLSIFHKSQTVFRNLTIIDGHRREARRTLKDRREIKYGRGFYGVESHNFTRQMDLIFNDSRKYQSIIE